MKTKITIIAAILLAAAIITSVKTVRGTTPLLEANVEALSFFEISVPIDCVKFDNQTCEQLFLTVDGYFFMATLNDMLKKGVIVV